MTLDELKGPAIMRDLGGRREGVQGEPFRRRERDGLEDARPHRQLESVMEDEMPGPVARTTR